MKTRNNKKIYYKRKRKYKENFYVTVKFSLLIFTIVIFTIIVLKTKDLVASIFNSETFTVKNIEIYNNKFLTDASILKTCKINKNEKIFDIDKKKLKKRLLKNGFIKNIEIRKNYPSTLEIYIYERTPFAFINLDKIYVIDENNTVLPELEFKKVYDIPVITGISGIEDKEKIDKSIWILKKLKDKEINIYSEISEINFNEDYKITFYLCQGSVPVYLGNKDIESKIKDLKYFLDYIEEYKKLNKIKYIDMRFNEQIITKEIS